MLPKTFTSYFFHIGSIEVSNYNTKKWYYKIENQSDVYYCIFEDPDQYEKLSLLSLIYVELDVWLLMTSSEHSLKNLGYSHINDCNKSRLDQ